jgi:hypothetical protein
MRAIVAAVVSSVLLSGCAYESLCHPIVATGDAEGATRSNDGRADSRASEVKDKNEQKAREGRERIVDDVL